MAVVESGPQTNQRKCDVCGKAKDIMFECKECGTDFDVCNDCYEKKTFNHDKSHHFQEIPNENWKRQAPHGAQSQQITFATMERKEQDETRQGTAIPAQDQNNNTSKGISESQLRSERETNKRKRQKKEQEAIKVLNRAHGYYEEAVGTAKEYTGKVLKSSEMESTGKRQKKRGEEEVELVKRYQEKPTKQYTDPNFKGIEKDTTDETRLPDDDRKDKKKRKQKKEPKRRETVERSASKVEEDQGTAEESGYLTGYRDKFVGAIKEGVGKVIGSERLIEEGTRQKQMGAQECSPSKERRSGSYDNRSGGTYTGPSAMDRSEVQSEINKDMNSKKLGDTVVVDQNKKGGAPTL